MASGDVLITVGTQICFADFDGDFSAAAGTDLEVAGATQIEMNTASVADGAGVNSDKLDLGATRAPSYSVMAAIEFAASVVAGNTVDLYWAPSTQSTAANGNPGGVDGSDGAYTGTTGSTVAESVLQLHYIGSFITTDDATTTVQVAYVGSFTPTERYGTLVLVNNSGVALHSDDVETHVVFNPNIPQGQS